MITTVQQCNRYHSVILPLLENRSAKDIQTMITDNLTHMTNETDPAHKIVSCYYLSSLSELIVSCHKMLIRSIATDLLNITL